MENNDLILKDGRYEIDFDDLEKKTADPRVRILLVCNPANPVGRVWTREELTRMYEICKKNHTLIVSDEIHGDIVYAPHRHIPYFSLSEEIADNVIVMGSPSKTFNLACFYSAYVVIHNEELREQYGIVYEDYHFDYNYLGIEALITAYNDCEYYADQQNEYLHKNIELVKSFLAQAMPEVKVIEPEATYLLIFVRGGFPRRNSFGFLRARALNSTVAQITAHPATGSSVSTWRRRPPCWKRRSGG